MSQTDVTSHGSVLGLAPRGLQSSPRHCLLLYSCRWHSQARSPGCQLWPLPRCNSMAELLSQRSAKPEMHSTWPTIQKKKKMSLYKYKLHTSRLHKWLHTYYKPALQKYKEKTGKDPRLLTVVWVWRTLITHTGFKLCEVGSRWVQALVDYEGNLNVWSWKRGLMMSSSKWRLCMRSEKRPWLGVGHWRFPWMSIWSGWESEEERTAINMGHWIHRVCGKIKKCRGFPGGSLAKIPTLAMQGARVRSSVTELDPTRRS